jgi:hypothetical protein
MAATYRRHHEQKPKGNQTMSNQTTRNLPAVGFEDAGDAVIRGAILKCVDGHWSAGGEPLTRASGLIALGTTAALQRWKSGFPVETIAKQSGADLPDVAELNAAIPQSEWQSSPDGSKRAPWTLAHVVYLLDPEDGSVLTFIGAALGAKLAVEALRDRVRMGRMLHGSNAMPVVALESRAMKTRFGTKMRPEFAVVGWREFGPRQQQIESLTTSDDDSPI